MSKYFTSVNEKSWIAGTGRKTIDSSAVEPNQRVLITSVSVSNLTGPTKEILIGVCKPIVGAPFHQIIAFEGPINKGSPRSAPEFHLESGELVRAIFGGINNEDQLVLRVVGKYISDSRSD